MGRGRLNPVFKENQLSSNFVGIVVGRLYKFVKYWAKGEDLFYRGGGGNFRGSATLLRGSALCDVG